MRTDAQPGASFVWPPRPVDTTARDVREAREEHAPSTRGEALAVTGSPAILATPALPSGWRQAIREVERVWLGLQTPPLLERMIEVGWQPDRPEAYCGRCGSSVGPGEADGSGCGVCRGSRLPWDRLVRLGEFDGLLRDVIHEVKFTRWRRLGDDLGRMLGASLAEGLTVAGINRRQAVVVPIGSSWRRRMARGIDHAMVLARGVAGQADLELVPALLREHRPTQTDLPRSKRRVNVAGSIRVKRQWERRLCGRVVVLVDDVTTTRATLAAASRAVREGIARWAKESGETGLQESTRIWGAIAGVTAAERQLGRRRMAGSAGENAAGAGAAG